MRIWLRPLPFALVAAFVVARAGRAPIDDAAPNRSAALCGALSAEGITCAAEDVTWLDGPDGVGGAVAGEARALVRGRENDELDLYMAITRLSPEGHLLDLDTIYNLTRTSSADEGAPLVKGTKAAYVVAVDGRPEAVHVLDFAGHDARTLEELSRFQRFQVGVGEWQATGERRGIKHTAFTLTPPPSKADLSWNGDKLEVKTPARTLVLDPDKEEVADGTAYARATPETVARPPTFAPWMSDRLRAVPWFGDEKNQMLKVVVFAGLESIKGTKSKLTGDTGEKDVQEDLGSIAGKIEPASFDDPELGWPPKPLEPMIKPGMTGEGQWISLGEDPFINPIPGFQAPFLTTFVRTDPSAQQTRVYVTLWDPRLVSLHMQAGTVEPVSATGEAGPGQIPRTPEVMRHVVAGFNGGFQATHGEFGMQADGVQYLPPKPYGATVMELRDGTTGFGSWPNDSKVPDEILSYRQNMNALVEGDKYNPWNRNWWGGVPPGWHDATHTTRSGICLTKEGFVAYFYGNDIGPEPLGRAMLLARCAYGIHLDMNPGLVGFEFYDVAPAATWKPLGRPLQSDWEFEGSVKEMPDFKFRSRRMIKSMGHMMFPRYIHRDARDFFYLTTRAVLPGAPIDEQTPWRVKGLPQHGFPYAIATANVSLAGKHARVLRVDPRTVKGEAMETAPQDAKEVVLVLGLAARAHTAEPAATAKKGAKDAGAAPARAPAPVSAPGGLKLWLGPHIFSFDKAAPADAVALADVVQMADGGESARVAVGISDEDGMLQWVELAPDEEPSAAASEEMLKLLEKLGCSARGLVRENLRAYPGGALDLGGEGAAPKVPLVRLTRTAAPAARNYFPDTEIVGPSVWQPLQAQRVKWRPTLAPPEPKPAASGSASAAPGSSAPPPK